MLNVFLQWWLIFTLVNKNFVVSEKIFNSFSHGGLLLKLTVVVILDHLRQQIWFSGFKGIDFLTVSPENPMLNFV
jgi:hypothetical protein